MPEQSLKNKTVKGVGWSAAETFLARGVSFIVGLVLARLLSPDEYGLIGIVMIFVTVLEGFVDSGFSSSLIRKIDADDNDYNTMFLTNLVISIVMFALLYLGAPYIAVFFERQELVALIRVMGLLVVFQAISIVQNTILTRKIDFKTRTKAAVLAAVVSGIIGIVMAFLDCGVWSLVGQQLSRQFLNTICLWFYNRWWPKFRFSTESFRYMWGFGWKIMASGLLDRLWRQLNQAVIGKYYSPDTLGQYTRSNEYATIFSSNITSVVQRVSYPVLSQVQDDKQRMVAAYRKVIKTTMFVTSIIMISMAAVSEPLIYCLIGPKWHQAALFLPFICFPMSVWPLHALNLNMLQVQGRSDVYLIVEILKKIIAIGPICLGIFVGIYWMLIGGIVTDIIAFFLNSYYSGKNLGYSSWMQIKDVAPSYALAFIVAISVYFFKFLPISNFIILPIQIVVGATVLFLICEKRRPEEYIELKNIVIKALSKIKK